MMTNPQDTTERMRDAAFPANIPADWEGAVGGYLHSPNTLNPWTRADWERFSRNRKLPIWEVGKDGHTDAQSAVEQLSVLSVPLGTPVALAMETHVLPDYVRNFANVLAIQGYKTWVCGSASTVFGNPAINGYMVEDFVTSGPFMYDHDDVRITQYQNGDKYDSSTVKDYTYDEEKWWGHS
jgi:hypothetical protein